MRKTDWLIIAIIAFVSIFLLKDIFHGIFYTSHDGPNQIVRLFYFDNAIKDGQMPPRWAGGLLNGFGYPLFIFSYHLPWIIAEPFHIIGFSIFDSIKLTFLLGYFLSGITMYFYQRKVFGKYPAFIGSLLYLIAPYRFSNIFVRAAIGDATSFIFPPLLFLSFYTIRKNGFSWIWFTVGSLSLACLLLSHAIVFLFFLALFIFYCAYSGVVARNWRVFLHGLGIIISGCFLSGYYFFPSLIEKSYTQFTSVFKMFFSGSTFVPIKELLYSPWGYGQFGSKEGAMSLQIGIVQWAAVLLSTAICIWYRGRLKDRTARDRYTTAIFFIFSFSVSVFLMTSGSKEIWKLIQNIFVVDFTWRILPVTLFSASILLGFSVSELKKFWWLGAVILIVAAYTNRNHTRINQSLDWPVSKYMLLTRTTNSFDEYLPHWVRGESVQKEKPKVEILETASSFKIIKNTSNNLTAEITATGAGILKLNTIYYPGWTITLNGKQQNINWQDGFMQIDIPKGKSIAIAEFKETTLRKVSNIFTLITLFSLGLLCIAKMSPFRKK